MYYGINNTRPIHCERAHRAFTKSSSFVSIQKLKNLLTNVGIAGHLSGNPYISYQILEFLNGYILFSIGPINTKLADFVKLDVLFQNIWVLCCLSRNTRTHTQAPNVSNPAVFSKQQWLPYRTRPSYKPTQFLPEGLAIRDKQTNKFRR